MIPLLTQEACGKHLKFTAILYYQFILLLFRLLTKLFYVRYNPQHMQNLDFTLMCIQKEQIQDF